MDVVESLAEKFIEFLIAYIPGARPDLTSLADNIVSQALCLRLSGPACGRYAFMLIVSSLETARPNQGSTISRSSPAKSLAPLLGPRAAFGTNDPPRKVDRVGPGDRRQP